MDGVQRLSVGEQTMRAGYVAVSKGGQGYRRQRSKWREALQRVLFVLRLPTSERQSPEFEYEAGGEFGILISVYQIPDNF
jgi:hypothetical protein